jgi:hypothetical protein
MSQQSSFFSRPAGFSPGYFTRPAGLGLLSTLGVLAVAGTSYAQNIETGNATSIFAGKPVAVSSTYPNPAFAAANLVDGGPASFIFNDGQATEYANISGFTVASGKTLSTLSFFDEPGFDSRTSPSVTIYIASNGTTSVSPTATGYNVLGTFALLYGTNSGPNSPDDYQIATSPADTSVNNNAGTIFYDTLTGLNIPAGTNSILFSFAQDPNFIGGPGGTSLSELQGFVTATPEPSSAVALGLGFLGLGALALKIRQRSVS